MAQEERVNYFQGMMLVDQDFKDEQFYHRQMRQKHNLELHTWGVVRGLEVTLDKGAVTVTEGLAIDASGKEIWWAGGLTAAGPGAEGNYLVIESFEVLGKDYPQMKGKYLRLTDTARISWKSAKADSDVVLAQLSQGQPDQSVRRTASSVRANGNNIEIRPVTKDGSLRLMTGAPLIERLTIVANGNVGIGTTDPGSSRLKVANSATDFVDVRFAGSGMGQLEIVGWGQGWNLNAKPNEKHLFLNRDSGEKSNVLIGRAGKELFVSGSNGNVGIGTGDPKAMLQVGKEGSDGSPNVRIGWGANNDEDRLTIFNSDGYRMGLRRGNRDLKIFAKSPDKDGHIYLMPNDAVAMSLLSGGNVGIATTAPEDKLQVGNSIRKFVVGEAYSAELGYGSSYAGFNCSRVREGGSPKWHLDGDSVHNGGSLVYGDIFGNLRLVTAGSTAGGGQSLTDTAIFKNTRACINDQIFDVATSLVIKGTERLELVQGNFGTLGGVDLAIYAPSTTTVAGVASGDTVVMGGERRQVDTVSPQLIRVKTPAFPFNNQGTPLYVVRPGPPILTANDHKGNAALTISNIGNVGIGTTDPGANRLRISRPLGGNDASSLQHDYQLEIRNGIGNRAFAIGLLDNGKAVLQVKEVNNVAGYTDLLLNPVAGNVGIGTASPGGQLEIRNSATNVKVKFGGSGGDVHHLTSSRDLVFNAAGGITFRALNAAYEDIAKSDDLVVISQKGDVKITGRVSCGGWIGLKTFHGTYVTANEDKSTMRQNLTRENWEQFTLEMACSREFKENIGDLSAGEAMATLQNLNPIKYDYKSAKSFRQNLGFIAEEMPDNLASEDRKSISPFEVIPVLTRVAKEQQATIAQLQETIRALQEEVRQNVVSGVSPAGPILNS